MRRILVIFFLLSFATAFSQSIVNTKHNLSVSGPGTVKATNETEICLFCHTAHNSKPMSPLWNRNDPGSTYLLYGSSTMKSTPGQPNGASMLCLSCHDGTIALGNVLSRQNTISFANTVTMPAGVSNLSTDLRNDHPISITYDATLVTLNHELKNPAALGVQVKLENDQVQCTSCHDPHKNLYTDFLVAPSQYSQICNICHDKSSWANSIHNTSTKTWNGVAPNPWPYTPWTTVNENACENCHNPHNSSAPNKLLKYAAEEDNCMDCHNGNASDKNIQVEFARPYRHDVYNYTGVHDPLENSSSMAKHVECVDCHNPHAATHTTAMAPEVKGGNYMVKGIDINGSDVTTSKFEYEICFRCHSANPVTGSTSARTINQPNMRLQFMPGNPSYHPVAAIGVNTTIQGLISPYTASSMIYCTDCHASNGSSASAGPHGSIYPQILKYDYDRSAGYVGTYAAYELCYQCHDQMKTIDSHNLFSISGTHGTLTSCNNCHDPHGISSTQGNIINNSYLINFNLGVVSNNSQGVLNYKKASPGHGACNLKCHGHDHIVSTY